MGWLAYLFAVAAGISSAVQAGANSQLRKSLDQPLLAALCVYGTGLVALVIAVPFTRLNGFSWSKAAQVPWWAWFGGLLSITSTMAGLMLAKKMGSTFYTATTVTCSILCSVALDHFGLVGFEAHPINPWRLAGCALLVAGLLLVSKF
jgi:bacterial/archaeal transporter family-2 protein